LSADFLPEASYLVLAMNCHTPYEKFDLSAQQGSEIVFTEAKIRFSGKFGPPEQAVTANKQTHMLASAQYDLQNHPELGGDWLLDVIAIRRLRGQHPEITHFENILTT